MKKLIEPIIAKINGYSKSGDGTARVQDRHRLQIIGAAIGDKVHVRIIRRERTHLLAKIVDILESAPERVKPKCIHAGTCGGCRLQHLSYDAQLQIKQKNIEELFPRYSVNPIIGCENIWNYRGKMEYSFAKDQADNRFLGLIESGSNGRVLDMQECHLAPENFMPILNLVKAWYKKHQLDAYSSLKCEGNLKSIAFRGNLQVTLTLAQRLPQEIENDLLAILKPHVTSIYLNINVAKRGVRSTQELIHIFGDTHFYEELTVGDKKLKLCATPYSFMQPNPKQSQVILEEAINMIAPKGDETLLDLYSGVGTIGLAFAPFVKKVISIEIVKDATENAKRNCQLNQITNIEFIASDVKQALVESKLPPLDIVIVDPPRGGIEPKAMRELLRLKAKKILYISCNPKTQSTDIKELEKEYKVGKIQPIDQFPHTIHTENLIILFRKSP